MQPLRRHLLTAMVPLLLCVCAAAQGLEGTGSAALSPDGGDLLLAIGEIPLSSVARLQKLTQQSRPGDVIALTAEGLEVRLVPGLPLALVNGRELLLAKAPHYRGAELMVSRHLLDAIRQARRSLGPAGNSGQNRPQVGRIFLRRILVDAGHGGEQRGAAGHGGTREKDVTLDIARRLARALRAAGVEVILTRDDDSSLSLAARSVQANRIRPDLLVSIHANWARSASARGIEVHHLANSGRARDSVRARSAARRHDIRDWDRSAPPRIGPLEEADYFKRLLADYRRESRQAAEHVLAALVARTGERDRGLKQSNLAVLRESYCPAILIEVGFLSHPQSEMNLRDGAYCKLLAAAIAQGIRAYAAKFDPER